MTEYLDDIEQSKKEWTEMNKKINEFTRWLSENDIDFKVVTWESCKGKDVLIDKVIVEFNGAGRIKFKTDIDEEAEE